MAKQLLFSNAARERVLAGVSKLTEAVRATMGPKGRNVLLEKSYGAPTVTKDGVTVAKEIELEDKFENMGAQLVKEAATRTNDAAGDGTTTATVLAHAIMEAGLKHLSSGSNAISIKRGIDKAVEAVVAELEKMKKDISSKDEYKAVANISAQDEEIGDVIAEVIDEAGKDGVVTVEAGQTLGIEKEYVEGMQFDNGYISPYFVTDPARMEAVFENASILITDRKIGSIQDILPLLEGLAQRGRKEIVIIAENIEGEALATLVVNKLRGTFSALAVKAPAFGDRRKEILKDIAALTGGRLISEEVGLKLENASVEDLGKAKKVIATKDSTTIVGGAGKKSDITARINEIKTGMEKSKSDFDKEKLQERLAKLTGGVAVIRVGAATEVEQKERQHRVEDALSATRAAAEEGILPGGGVAYIRAMKVLDVLKAGNEDEQIGVEIVKEALLSPLRNIAANAGAAQDVVVDKVRQMKGNEGFNALTGKYEDMVKARIIDPKKVTRSALQNAASVASMFLTLEAAVAEIPKKEEHAPMQGGGMGGMDMM
ncbi:chaperonin GroL [Candidatus Peribacteria bacterium RIFOXYC1_FULL_54_13]|nr:MAG: 60 kDa chaperonin [Candidatus Peregrinibacteria bacterium GW2011_GWA2_54_9]OGJ73096.1 MAG: chaperonin GroL [Candidatus Peribacteria bacterium RIFOXYA1_FULL_56_14]OGJ74443.1 MAG: chaperonin GroL [Candidatus Peribacteria bacterium RIFOXYA2_FULL_55_28]OGJ75707.1 MAG: chaperonin GroL [Candidatus Peribacteria bacterium RIFOXYB1_FULL_54_35]OGJ76628.1 MAG: chaperonin GroL [Candidatus Peribacteria bacterium RIFOXYB2_FULL_54_17]OGJ79302.1 MAG: chaperonin GroL [Candidatus Peribacteria bacterium 